MEVRFAGQTARRRSGASGGLHVSSESPLGGSCVSTDSEMQRPDPRVAQLRSDEPPIATGQPGDRVARAQRAARRPAAEGLPGPLRSGLEQLSGFDLSTVRVRRNSAEPAKYGALAMTRGTEIDVAPGQERHLPHEGWHVVQQLQGRVPSRIQAKGVHLNADDQLEREADAMGERASRTHGQRTEALAPPPETDVAVVQRKVGFEYELGRISTTKTRLIGSRTKLPKKDVLVRGTGYTVEADEETLADPNYAAPSYSGYSDLEFVTDAFPVTVAGFGQLTTALSEIAAITTYIANNPNTDISAAALPHGNATARRYVRFAGGPMIGKPQATVGLSLTAMARFFQDISRDPAGAANPATTAQELFGGGVDVAGGSTAQSAAVVGLADVTTARVAAQQEVQATLPPAEVTPEMVALVTQLLLYLDLGEQGAAGYGKTIAGSFMMRTAFDRVYRSVPAGGRIFTDANPDLFALMVGRAARRMNGNISDNGDVFSGGIYNDHFKYGPASAEAKSPAQRQAMTGHLRRRDWLQGIASGTDRLTQANFPSRSPAHLEEIESLGSYGQNTDPLGAQQLPILEFRGLPPLPPGLFTVMAMDVFRYVFAMATAGGAGNPGALQALGLNERNVLYDPTDATFANEVQSAVAQATAAVAAWGPASGGD